MRCLALAEAIRDRGGEVVFVSQACDGNLLNIINERGFRSQPLSAESRTETEDAIETLQICDDADCHIVDHYFLGGTWEYTVRRTGSRIVAIDDLANRRHLADILVDSTFPGDVNRYLGLSDGLALLGTRFALLGADYRLARRAIDAGRHGDSPRVLVFMGGSDIPGMTLVALTALAGSDFEHFGVDIVIGANSPHIDAIERMSRRHRRWRMYGQQASLAPLFSQADFAITAGGVTLLERACAGVPGVTVSLADNQLPSTTALATAGVTTFVGRSEEVTPDLVSSAMIAIISSEQLASEMRLRGLSAVDGLGALRVAEVLLPTPRDRLLLRAAQNSDVAQYFEWANEDEVRAQSLSSRTIDWDTHVTWFAEKLASPHSYLYVLEAKGLPVAQARFERRGDSLVLGYSVDYLHRSRGLGTEVVTRAIDALPETGPREILATVKRTNLGSLGALTKAGFRPLYGDLGTDESVQLSRMR